MVVSEESVRKLAKLLDETHLTEIEYQVGTHRIRVTRGGTMVPSYGPPMAAPSAPLGAPVAPVADIPQAPPPSKGETIASPMVGTAYLAAEPGGSPFIKLGDVVEKGATLLIIEAMKVMNPIRAPREGRVVEICIADAKPVEFGEALIILE